MTRTPFSVILGTKESSIHEKPSSEEMDTQVPFNDVEESAIRDVIESKVIEDSELPEDPDTSLIQLPTEPLVQTRYNRKAKENHKIVRPSVIRKSKARAKASKFTSVIINRLVRNKKKSVQRRTRNAMQSWLRRKPTKKKNKCRGDRT